MTAGHFTFVNVALPKGATGSTASSINASREIAGEIFEAQNKPVIWSKTGVATLLPIGTDTNVNLTGLNALGDATGDVTTSTGDHDAVLWIPGAKAPKILNDAGGDHDDQVLAINKSAQSVGWSSHPVTGNGIQDEAVLWTSTGKSTVLTTPAGTLYSLATCINNNGIIGGFVYNGNANGEFATEWSAATGAIHWSVAGYNALLAVNSSGEALASSSIP